MAEDMEIINDDDLEIDTSDNFLLTVINHQIDTLYSLDQLDYSSLYDAAVEGKINCVSNSFKVIAAAQEKLLQQIKEIE